MNSSDIFVERCVLHIGLRCDHVLSVLISKTEPCLFATGSRIFLALTDGYVLPNLVVNSVLLLPVQEVVPIFAILQYQLISGK